MAETEIIAQIFIAFTAARLLGRLVARLGVPSVVGELLAGAILGPYLLGIIEHNQFMDALAELGVILLLFSAGLGTHIGELANVKGVATAVGIMGAVLPFVAGFAVAFLFDYPLTERLFVATALMATSVGITVRVLEELGFHKRKSARIILAAAVIDDIVGLFVLTLVIGYAQGETDVVQILVLTLGAAAFLAFFLLVGPRAINRLSESIARISAGFFLELAIIAMLGVALLAQFIGLAAIVGAFLAGIVLAEVKQHHRLEEQVEPLARFFTPFFFVSVGAYVDFSSFTKPPVLVATIVFTVAAIMSKYAGSLAGAWRQGKRIANEVGVGMIPRGEVGIVVAGIALAEGVVDKDAYGAVLAMVVITTFVAPFLIVWVYKRGGRRGDDKVATPPPAPTDY